MSHPYPPRIIQICFQSYTFGLSMILDRSTNLHPTVLRRNLRCCHTCPPMSHVHFIQLHQPNRSVNTCPRIETGHKRLIFHLDQKNILPIKIIIRSQIQRKRGIAIRTASHERTIQKDLCIAHYPVKLHINPFSRLFERYQLPTIPSYTGRRQGTCAAGIQLGFRIAILYNPVKLQILIQIERAGYGPIVRDTHRIPNTSSVSQSFSHRQLLLYKLPSI